MWSIMCPIKLRISYSYQVCRYHHPHPFKLPAPFHVESSYTISLLTKTRVSNYADAADSPLF